MPKTELDPFRSLRKEAFAGSFLFNGVAKQGLLYPGFEPKPYQDNNGVDKVRAADVLIKKNDVSGTLEVQPGGGTSLFDVTDWFGTKHWDYFQIFSGTDYPDSLFIKKDQETQLNLRKKVGRHYEIQAKNPMTVDAMKGALDTFARNAIALSVERSK